MELDINQKINLRSWVNRWNNRNFYVIRNPYALLAYRIKMKYTISEYLNTPVQNVFLRVKGSQFR